MGAGAIVGVVGGCFGVLMLLAAAVVVVRSSALRTASENFKSAAESWKSRYDAEAVRNEQLQDKVTEQSEQIVDLKVRVRSLEAIATARPEIIELGKVIAGGIATNEARHEENLLTLSRAEGSLSRVETAMQDARAAHERIEAAINRILAAVHAA
jgi:chromosome segregation ATPase